jgi:hypothetical protein
MEPGLIFRHTRLCGGRRDASRLYDPSIHFIDFILTENIYLSANCTISDGIVRKDEDILFKNEAPINDFLISAYQYFQLSYPKFYKMDNLSKLGWLTAELLLQNSFDKDDYEPEDIGIVLANANSSLDDDLKYCDTIADIASPSLFVYTLPNIVMGEISIRHRFKGEQALFVQEEFTPGFIYQQVSYLLDNDLLQACICGWVDVIGEAYKSVLFLVEKTKNENAVLFSAENMDKIFNTKAD